MSDVPPPSFPPPSGPLPPGRPLPPPGYVAYGAGNYGAFTAFEPIARLARVLTWLIGAAIALGIATSIMQMKLSNDAQRFLEGNLSSDEFLRAVGVSNVVVLPSAAVGIAAAVITIIWMFRIAKNLVAAGRTGQKWKPGWAIGGWFVPPAVLYVIPWLMLQELWRGSDSSTRHDPAWNQAKANPLIHLWWVVYGLLPLVTVGNAVRQFSLDFDTTATAERLEGAASSAWIGAAVNVVAGVLFIAVIRQLTARHRQLTGEA